MCCVCWGLNLGGHWSLGGATFSWGEPLLASATGPVNTNISGWLNEEVILLNIALSKSIMTNSLLFYLKTFSWFPLKVDVHGSSIIVFNYFLSFGHWVYMVQPFNGSWPLTSLSHLVGVYTEKPLWVKHLVKGADPGNFCHLRLGHFLTEELVCEILPVLL